MFQVTPAAAAQILRAAEVQDDEPSLRVAARIDEDGERVYGMGFDEERENDLVLECEGVQILISPHSQHLLAATVLDFVELQQGEFQFVFRNEGDLSCGSSAGGCGGCGSRSCG